MDIYLATIATIRHAIRHPSARYIRNDSTTNPRLSKAFLVGNFPFRVAKKEGRDIENNVADDWLVRCLRWLGYLYGGWKGLVGGLTRG